MFTRLFRDCIPADWRFRKNRKCAYVEEVHDTAAELRKSDISIHEKFWRPLFNSLTKKIGPIWDQYREVVDPYDNTIDEVVVGSLADDLSDSYVDLLKGEQYWSRSFYDEAVWKWRFGFGSHWGEHATGA